MKQFFITLFDSAWITDLYNYLYENIVCLTFGIQMLPEETAYFGAFFSLIKDIAEGYGAWTAFIILFISVFTVVIAIQQLVEYSVAKFLSLKRKKNSLNRLSNENFFQKINLFKYFK